MMSWIIRDIKKIDLLEENELMIKYKNQIVLDALTWEEKNK